jgi:RNA polymerase sigma factor (sigma-70 family)
VGTQTEDASATAPAANLQAKAREAYGRQSRQAVEDQLIIDHLPLVRHIVQKVVGNLGRRPDADDLISAGTIGLVRAARAYDPSRHTEFKTYAYIRVRGAVIDELRSQSFSSPSIRQRIRSIREAHRRHAVETGQPPTDQDLADRAGLSLRMYYQTVEEARRLGRPARPGEPASRRHHVAGDRGLQTRTAPPTDTGRPGTARTRPEGRPALLRTRPDHERSRRRARHHRVTRQPGPCQRPV